MILLTHLLFGALIGQQIHIFWIAIILSFFGHYFLDFFPHIEYPIENITKNQWQKSFPDFLKVAIDFLLGIFVIFSLSNNSFIVYACSFFAILPDGLSLLSRFCPNNKLLKNHDYFHHKKIHILKDKKISVFWRFLTQIIVVIIAIFLLKY